MATSLNNLEQEFSTVIISGTTETEKEPVKETEWLPPPCATKNVNPRPSVLKAEEILLDTVLPLVLDYLCSHRDLQYSLSLDTETYCKELIRISEEAREGSVAESSATQEDTSKIRDSPDEPSAAQEQQLAGRAQFRGEIRCLVRSLLDSGSSPMLKRKQPCPGEKIDQWPVAQSIEEDLAAKKHSFPEDERRQWKFIHGVFCQLRKACPIFGILVIGETGTGKSTLINNLLGKEVATVGHTMESETLIVTPHELSIEGVPVVVYDSPGLDDSRGSKYDKKHLEIMKSLLAREKIHLVIYCLKMTETRMRRGLMRTFKEYHKIGVPWEQTVITLTFADNVKDTMHTFYQMRQQIKKTLVEKVGVIPSTVERLKICPTAKDPTKALPIGRVWYVPFWLDVVEVPAAMALFLDIHKCNIQVENVPVASKPSYRKRTLINIDLAGEDKKRFEGEVIRLIGTLTTS